MRPGFHWSSPRLKRAPRKLVEIIGKKSSSEIPDMGQRYEQRHTRYGSMCIIALQLERLANRQVGLESAGPRFAL